MTHVLLSRSYASLHHSFLCRCSPVHACLYIAPPARATHPYVAPLHGPLTRACSAGVYCPQTKPHRKHRAECARSSEGLLSCFGEHCIEDLGAASLHVGPHPTTAAMLGLGTRIASCHPGPYHAPPPQPHAWPWVHAVSGAWGSEHAWGSGGMGKDAWSGRGMEVGPHKYECRHGRGGSWRYECRTRTTGQCAWSWNS